MTKNTRPFQNALSVNEIRGSLFAKLAIVEQGVCGVTKQDYYFIFKGHDGKDALCVASRLDIVRAIQKQNKIAYQLDRDRNVTNALKKALKAFSPHKSIPKRIVHEDRVFALEAG